MTQLFNKFYIPEDVGISSVAIAQFLKECDEINYKLRTLHIVRHDKAIAEVSKYPFCALDKRLVYSVSKTFTSTAIGIAVKEGLLRVDDFLLDYFPECRDLDMDDAARTIKICHLLTMSTGHGVDTVGDMCNGIRPWPEIFFTRKIVYEPGTHFVYNSGGTYMLSELISRVTGMCLKDWLQTHLFDPLKITDVSWDKHGDVNTGAWGLLIAPRDLTKLGLLYLHKGVYNGIRILTEEWVTEASYPHISTNVQGCAGWGRHYGYQIWENSPGSYRADGAFGQYCMVFPKMDMVITTTAEETDGSRIFPLIEKYILNNITEQPKPRDAWCYQYMKNVMNQWETPVVYSPSASYLMHMLQGKEFDLRSRTSDEKHTLRFEIGNSRMEFVIDEIQTIHSSCTVDLFGETTYAIEIPSNSPLIGDEQRNRIWKYAAHHSWVDQSTLILTICWQETGHSQTWKFYFHENTLTLIVTDGTKGMFELSGAVSDRNVRFADMIFDGAFR